MSPVRPTATLKPLQSAAQRVAPFNLTIKEEYPQMALNLLGTNSVVHIGLVIENIDNAVQTWSHLLGVDPPHAIIIDTVDIAHTLYQDNPTLTQAKLAFFNLGKRHWN